MKRYNLFLEESMILRLQGMADRTDSTVSALIREAIEVKLLKDERAPAAQAELPFTDHR